MPEDRTHDEQHAIDAVPDHADESISSEVTKSDGHLAGDKSQNEEEETFHDAAVESEDKPTDPENTGAESVKHNGLDRSTPSPIQTNGFAHVAQGQRVEGDGTAEDTTEIEPSTPTTPKGDDELPPISKDLVQQITQSPTHTHGSKKSVSLPFSEHSHQQLAVQSEPAVEESEEGEWQTMPALATHRVYDDWGKVIAKSYDEVDDESYGYGNLGGAGKGYTKVHLDDDVTSQTSFDDNTAYLFKDGYARNALDDDDDEARDLLSQMQTTKELLTEGQRIAYVGVVRLSMIRMLAALDALERTKGAKKSLDMAAESMRLWSQKMMVRIYSHMDIDSREQIMVEQLAEHGVLPEDLTPALMQNARVKNPKTAESDTHEQQPETSKEGRTETNSYQAGINKHSDEAVTIDHEEVQEDTDVSAQPGVTSTHEDIDEASRSASTDEGKADKHQPEDTAEASQSSSSNETSEKQDTSARSFTSNSADTAPGGPGVPPPAYEHTKADGLHVERPEDLPDTTDIDLDIRWTVLCDLFLLLIADGQYDSRSRVLLEMVGKALAIEWQEICRFEKRVTDALEMQEQAGKETWNEEDNLESRRKQARKKRLIVMGLCTVGGGLVIGLSAGLLAPVIGAGLAAGFTSIGVAGTSSFFAGAGAATLIGTTGAGIGARIGINASDRRTGAVKTFEYRPLQNNKRVNLIVTVSGWMTGDVDDVRLPFSTVDPVMGDIYSVYWEPEMLQSTGQTIQILATEALTQTIQQILGATALSALMAGLAAPIVLTKLAYLIDNPWTVSLARADAAGLILADSLIDRNLGARPITLVGFSLGARLIFSCLREMARRGAIGIVQNVFLFGSPIVTRNDEWLRAKAVVSGRLVNGYASHDWILSYLFRATSGGLRSIAGLSKVNVPGVENVDVAQIVPGHMAYRQAMPILLAEVGWEVESEEFTEIEDPDPDNHQRRQRQLISDIEEARRQLDEKPEKKGFFSRFSRKKAAKREWETYDENAMRIDDEQDPETIVKQNADVLFDVEAIRREALELAKQGEPLEDIVSHMSIREVKTTLPPMRISSANFGLSPTSNESNSNGLAVHGAIRQTRSHDEPSRSFSLPDKGRSSHSSTADDANSPITKNDNSPRPPSPSPSNSRPVLRTNLTAPNITSTSEPSFQTQGSTQTKHNPWDEEEDADFGQEKAIEMSFE